MPKDQGYEVYDDKKMRIEQEMPIMGKSFANDSMDDMLKSTNARGKKIREMTMPVGSVKSNLIS